jgi:hypothetical protein
LFVIVATVVFVQLPEVDDKVKLFIIVLVFIFIDVIVVFAQLPEVDDKIKALSLMMLLYLV